ncbi:MAG: DUF3341 domain-containing protein [Deltaproteobacteria bacterium]|nr:DUF3341 domain-containing protein [Deltaproteobacteria bacterium]
MPEPSMILFDDPHHAEDVVRRLRECGVDDVHVTSPAAYPVTEETKPPFGWRLFGLLALTGGLTGLATAIALVVHGSETVPLIVGGKAVLAWPAFSVVMFELTMLGAGVANFLGVIVLSAVARRGLPKRARMAAAEGHIAVLIPAGEHSAEQREEIRRVLEDEHGVAA